MTRAVTILIQAGVLSVTACSPQPDPRHPGAVGPGHPFSRLCAPDDPCPGITREKLRVCGECDPATRYFRRSICSLGAKMRKAVNSCVETSGGVQLSGETVFGSHVKACVKQQLNNEPAVLKEFVAVARGHAAKEEEQRAWRRHCEQRWTEHRRHKLGGPGAVTPTGPGVGALLIKTRPPRASVWIDGRRRRGVEHRGWLKFQDLSVGEHGIKLRIFDQYALSTTVIVAADKEKEYTLVLRPLPTCNNDADCRGHAAGPRCFEEGETSSSRSRCSCTSNADCTDPGRTICRPIWKQASRRICDSGRKGRWCKQNDHCRSHRCKKPGVTRIYGLCQ